MLTPDFHPPVSHPPRPSNPPRKRLIILDGGELALALARSRPDCNLLVFESTWNSVDRLRAAVSAAGLDSRVSVRHASARRLVA